MRTHDLTMRLSALVPALLFSCWAAFSQATERTSSYFAALESISAQELQDHVDYLSDDALEGREPGTKGSRQAGDYLAARLEELQIRGAGVDGGFIQPFDSNVRNVLGIIEGSDPELKNETILVCAHYDHVGYGTEENSAGPIGLIHNGADDNASGTAALLELAEALTRLPQAPGRSILFAFWDAEEMEMLGSRHWVAHPTIPLEDVVVAINLDMVGRLRDNRLTVYGTRSGLGFRRLLSRQNDAVGLEIDFSWELEDDSDHHTFVTRGIPVLFPHTGLHDEFHSPRDDAHLINSQGINRIVRLLFHLVCDLGERPETPDFRQAASLETEALREQLADHPPTLPDRFGARAGQPSPRQPGVRISQVVYNSPAARAGLRAGDRIVQFAGSEVPSEDSLTSAVLLAEHQVPVVVRRGNQPESLKLSVQLDGDPMRLGVTWREDDAEPGTVILTHIVTGSPAANAGLRAGDRIYQVAAQDFADGDAFVGLVGNASDTLQLLVERDGQLRTVVVYFHGDLQKRAA